MNQVRGRLVEGRFGPYEILASLGSQGTVELYLATKMQGAEGLDRFVVVREHPAADEESTERMAEEIRIHTLFGHQNTSRVEEFILLEDGSLLEICEYLDGDSLGCLIERVGTRKLRITPEVAVAIMIQVCHGLDYAHNFHDTNGLPLYLLHRMINPDNIVVLTSGEVKLVNFDVSGRHTNQIAYQAPEQALGLPPDQRSDIYSLGIILWELLAGRHLYKSYSDEKTQDNVLSERVPMLRKVAPEVPAQLESIIMRALIKNPGMRHDSAEQLASELLVYLQRTGVAGDEDSVKEFFDPFVADRLLQRLKLLAQIESSAEHPQDLSLLLPGVSESFLPLADPTPPPEPEISVLRPLTPIPVPKQAAKPAPARMKVELKKPDGTPAGEQEKPPPAPAPVKPAAPKPAAAAPFFRHRLFKPLAIGACVLIATLTIVLASIDSGSDAAPDAGAPAVDQMSPEKAAAAEPAAEPSAPDPVEEKKPEPEELAIIVPPETAAVPSGPGSVMKPEPELVLPQATLTVKSKPSGCRVRLGKKTLEGKTPLEDIPLKPGKHRITVACRNHEKQTKRVRVRKGQNKVISFSPTRMKKQEYGSLRLVTVPWTEVYKGSVKLGVTPLAGMKMKAGSHTLKLINRSEGISETLRVRIDPNKTTSIRKKLNR